jgi:hypothetical protein
LFGNKEEENSSLKEVVNSATENWIDARKNPNKQKRQRTDLFTAEVQMMNEMFMQMTAS